MNNIKITFEKSEEDRKKIIEEFNNSTNREKAVKREV